MQVVAYVLLCHPYIWHIRKNTCFWRISNGSDLLLNVDDRQKYSRAVSDISAITVVFCYQCYVGEGRYLLQKEFLLPTWCFHVGFHTGQCMIHAQLLEAWDLCPAVRAQCSSGFHTDRRKMSQLHLWAKQLDNQTEHLISVLNLFFLKERVQLAMNSSLYLHFCGFKWKDQVKF